MKITFKDFKNQMEYLKEKGIKILQIRENHFPNEFEIKGFGIDTGHFYYKEGLAIFRIESNEHFGSKESDYRIQCRDLIEKDVQYYIDKRKEEQRTLIPQYEEEIKKASEELEKLESELRTKISLVRKYAKVNSVSKMIEESERADKLNRKIKDLRRKIKDKEEHIISLL